MTVAPPSVPGHQRNGRQQQEQDHQRVGAGPGQEFDVPEPLLLRDHVGAVLLQAAGGLVLAQALVAGFQPLKNLLGITPGDLGEQGRNLNRLRRLPQSGQYVLRQDESWQDRHGIPLATGADTSVAFRSVKHVAFAERSNGTTVVDLPVRISSSPAAPRLPAAGGAARPVRPPDRPVNQHGHRRTRTILSATLPKSKRFRPLRPWVAMAMTSMSLSRARSSTAAAADSATTTCVWTAEALARKCSASLSR